MLASIFYVDNDRSAEWIEFQPKLKIAHCRRRNQSEEIKSIEKFPHCIDIRHIHLLEKKELCLLYHYLLSF